MYNLVIGTYKKYRIFILKSYKFHKNNETSMSKYTFVYNFNLFFILFKLFFLTYLLRRKQYLVIIIT